MLLTCRRPSVGQTISAAGASTILIAVWDYGYKVLYTADSFVYGNIELRNKTNFFSAFELFMFLSNSLHDFFGIGLLYIMVHAFKNQIPNKLNTYGSRKIIHLLLFHCGNRL